MGIIETIAFKLGFRSTYKENEILEGPDEVCDVKILSKAKRILNAFLGIIFFVVGSAGVIYGIYLPGIIGKIPLFIGFFVAIAGYTYMKMAVTGKQYRLRTEQEMKNLEIGIVPYHSKEIIKYYGSAIFLNKTQEEIEIIVNEYIDLFKVDLKEYTANDIAKEIKRELNE